MKKIKLSFAAIVAVLLVSMAFVRTDQSANNLAQANVEALADSFRFNGQNWDTDDHWYNNPGGSWMPFLDGCTVSTSTGGGGSAYQMNFIATTTITYNGQYVACVYGHGNCWDGTTCQTHSR